MQHERIQWRPGVAQGNHFFQIEMYFFFRSADWVSSNDLYFYVIGFYLLYRQCLRNIIKGSIFLDGDIRYVFFSCESVVFPVCFVGSDHWSTKQGPIWSSHKTKSRSQYITSHCPSITGFNVQTSSSTLFLSWWATPEFYQSKQILTT